MDDANPISQAAKPNPVRSRTLARGRLFAGCI